MRDSEIVREAIALLEKYGWIQGKAGSPDEGMCAIGALAYASAVQRGHANTLAGMLAGMFDTDHITAAVSNVVGGGVVAFNDNPSTSYEDVVLALKQAATNLEGVGR
jgi:hypothetical protein